MTTAGPPPFPGAVGVSHLRVYDSEAPDGLRGGTPHIHTVCSEAYAVVRGRGAVQTLTMGGFAETPIEAGSFVWFTPGTVHRLINRSGDLEILVIMQNAGLPEAGDLVITMPPAVLDDAPGYAALAVLPPEESTTAGSGGAARLRRDLGVEGFVELKAALDGGDTGPLARFYARAAALVQPKAGEWEARWRATALRAATATGEQIEAVVAGHVDHLLDASVHLLPPPADERRMGCCGTLGTYVP
jgi:mannose-6-phosphate isomerase-like protein (cupin superfamily)